MARHHGDAVDANRTRARISALATDTAGRSTMSEDVDAKLATYRQQLAQVEAAIAQDPDNQEWTKLRTDLNEVIELTSELAEVRASTAENDGEARTYAVGEKCQALYEQESAWYNAKIVATAEDGYFVTFLGYGNTAQVEFNEVRPYVRPDTTGWRKHSEVTAVHPSDGRWYDATVVEVRAGSVLVKFAGEGESSEVDIDFVRTKMSQARPATSPPGGRTRPSVRPDAP